MQVPDEETLRNDYAGQYVQTGARPQNHLRNTAVETRFAEWVSLLCCPFFPKGGLTQWRWRAGTRSWRRCSTTNTP